MDEPAATSTLPLPEPEASAAPPAPTPSRKRLIERWTWTVSQRRALLVLLFGAFILLTVRWIRQARYVDNPQPAHSERAGELANRLDPNQATWQELAAIPQLGEKRAMAIVAYRDQRQLRVPGETVFKSPIDLVVVKGIGAGTVDGMKAFLVFPSDATTKPAVSGQ